MWVQYKLSPMDTGMPLMMIARWQLSGAPHLPALQAAWMSLVKANECLRMYYSETAAGKACLRIVPGADDSLQCMQMRIESALPPTHNKGDIEAAIATWRNQLNTDIMRLPLAAASILPIDTDCHVLVIAMHHAVVDGTTNALLLKDLSDLYSKTYALHAQGQGAGNTVAVPKLPQRQHASVLEFQAYEESWLTTSPDRERLRKVYKEYMVDAELGLEFPLLTSSMQHGPPGVSRLDFELPSRLSEQLERYARSQHTTVFLTLSAAYAVLLGRYCNQDDVTIAYVSGQRPRAFNGLRGLLVTLLPLRADMRHGPTFEALLRHMTAHRAQVSGEHCLTSGDPLTGLHGLMPGQMPYKAVISASHLRGRAIQLPGVCRSSFKLCNPHFSVSPGLVLTVDLETRPAYGATLEPIICTFMYGSSGAAGPMLSSLAQSLEALLCSIVTPPPSSSLGSPEGSLGSRCVQDLRMLSDAQHDTLLAHACGPIVPEYLGATGRGVTLPELLERQVARSPSAPALLYERQVLSYAQLHRRATVLASQLAAAGVAPGVVAAVYMQPCPDALLAILAVAQTGAAYAPLDPKIPFERLKTVLEDCRPAVMITHTPLLEASEQARASVPDLAMRVCNMDGGQLTKMFCEDMELPASAPAPSAASPNDPAYILFTSGSTGKPKGCIVPHRAVANVLQHSTAEFDLGPGSRMLHGHINPAFDLSVYTMWAPLCAGGLVLMAPPAQLIAGDPLMQTVNTLCVTHMMMPTAMIAVLDPQRCPSLQLAVFAGETLPLKPAQHWARSGIKTVNAYGPTECAIYQSNTRPVSSDWSLMHIGRPVANVRVYVLPPGHAARATEPLPMGVIGEVCTAGVQVGYGYLNRPAETAARFVSSSLCCEKGQAERLYITGDLGRLLPSGDIEYLGRGDHQVKIQGHRIELGEVEHAALHLPGVKQAIAVAHGERMEHRQLVLYVATLDDTAPGSSLGGAAVAQSDLTAQWQEALRARLPAYMVPAIFVIMPSLPLNPNGKVDRKALPSPRQLRTLAGAIAPSAGVATIAATVASTCKAPDMGAAARTETFVAPLPLTPAAVAAPAKGVVAKAAHTTVKLGSMHTAAQAGTLAAPPLHTPVTGIVASVADARAVADEAAGAHTVVRFGNMGTSLQAATPAASLPISAAGKVMPAAGPTARVGPQPGPGRGRAHVQQAWWASLDIDGVALTPESHFFLLGGNSLLAIQVHGMLRAMGYKQLMVTDLFQYYTYAMLADHLDVLRDADPFDAPEQLWGGAASESLEKAEYLPSPCPLYTTVACNEPAPGMSAAAATVANTSVELDTMGTAARLFAPAAVPLPTAAAMTVAPAAGPAAGLGRTHVQQAWRAVLDIDDVALTPESNFFLLGGNSLLAIQVHGMLRAMGYKRLMVTDLFQYYTYGTLANRLDVLREADLFDAPEALQALPPPEQVPLTRKQDNISADADAAVSPGGAIAIIGMAGRFPGARSVTQLWDNLVAGQESVRLLTDDELSAAGVTVEDMRNRHYVKKRAMLLDDPGLFDADFFGMSPMEATVLDPQQRLFLEVAFEALESAGYGPGSTALAAAPPVGIYGGCGRSLYFTDNVLPNAAAATAAGRMGLFLASASDFLCTRVSHKLGLTGPAMTVQTACSTSGSALHVAVTALRAGHCGMALAGGVSLLELGTKGYLYAPGGIVSPEGQCRPFSATANGTVPGQGAAMLLLRPLEDAITVGDEIIAVVKGIAANNDGAGKSSFTAPSAFQQAAVIGAALTDAGISPHDIAFVEAHGTGTALGDPIELQGLADAYATAAAAAVASSTSRAAGAAAAGWQSQWPDRATGLLPPNSIALGSIKSNFGHLDAAAGMAGVIKAALALRHGLLPPSLHAAKASPHIRLGETPFFVNNALLPLRSNVRKQPGAGGRPLCAGVSCFGMGGTNVHVVLEEAPCLPRPAPAAAASSRLPKEGVVQLQRGQVSYDVASNGFDTPGVGTVLCLSAKCCEALASAAHRLADDLQVADSQITVAGLQLPRSTISDVAAALLHTRGHLPHRLALVCPNTSSGAADALRAASVRAAASGKAARAGQGAPPVVLLFPGQGSEWAGMGQQLYCSEPEFKASIDACMHALNASNAAALAPSAGGNELPMLSWSDVSCSSDFVLRQVALLCLEVSLARLIIAWGIVPSAVLGHSLGEYAAAVIAGIMKLPDAVGLVMARGRLLQERCVEGGGMLAVMASEGVVATALLQPPLANMALDLAAVNSASQCVVSGAEAALLAAEQAFAMKGVRTTRLASACAFHSRAVEPVYWPYRAEVQAVELRSPHLGYVSSMTGTWAATEQVCSPEYWVRHLRQPVRFHAALTAVRNAAHLKGVVLLELGPGTTLTGLAKPVTAGEGGPGSGANCSGGGGSSSGSLAVSVLPGSNRRRPDVQPAKHEVWQARQAMAALWEVGVPVQWDVVLQLQGQARRHVTLPTYPFQRKRFWLDAPVPASSTVEPSKLALPQLHHIETSSPPVAPAKLVTPDAKAPQRPSLLAACMGEDAQVPATPASEHPDQAAVACTIARVWSEFLGVPHVGPHDDFWSLGGHSLMAVEVAVQLGATLDVEVEPFMIGSFPTPHVLSAELSRLLRGSSSSSSAASEASLGGDSSPTTVLQGSADVHSLWSGPDASDGGSNAAARQPAAPPALAVVVPKGCLVLLRAASKPSLAPLYLMHAIGGGVLYYRELVQALRYKGAVYGLRAPKRAELDSCGPLDTIEAIAAAYLVLIQRQHQSGMPYHLAGSSFGGLLAYEMAQQATAAGLQVSMLALIDTPGIGAMPPVFSVEELRCYIANSYAKIPMVDQANPDLSMPATVPDWYLDTWMRHDRAMRAYIVQPYAGTLLYVRHADEMEGFPPNPHQPWLELALGGITLHQVPGDHISMNHGSNVVALAEVYDKVLQQYAVASMMAGIHELMT